MPLHKNLSNCLLISVYDSRGFVNKLSSLKQLVIKQSWWWSFLLCFYRLI